MNHSAGVIFFCANLPELAPRFSIAKEKKFAIINSAKIKNWRVGEGERIGKKFRSAFV